MAMVNAVPAPRTFTRKGSATRDRIVAAAAVLIFKRGVAHTTTENVCDAADVSTSQLYHYFKDKMALVRAVIDRQTENVLDAQREYLGRLDSIPRLRAWRDHVVGLQLYGGCKGGCPLGTLSSELSECSDEARGDIALGFARWEDGIFSGLQAMRDRGELGGNADPRQLALATLAALQGGLVLTQLRRDPEPLRAALDAIIDHIESLVRAESIALPTAKR